MADSFSLRVFSASECEAALTDKAHVGRPRFFPDRIVFVDASTFVGSVFSDTIKRNGDFFARSCCGLFRAEGTVLCQPGVERREWNERRATLGWRSGQDDKAPTGRPNECDGATVSRNRRAVRQCRLLCTGFQSSLRD